MREVVPLLTRAGEDQAVRIPDGLFVGAARPLDGEVTSMPCRSDAIGIEEAGMWQLLRELMAFLREEKKWWLIPLVVVLLLLAVLVLFSANPALAPFMYPFM